MDNFDPSIKESPDLPGELHEEELVMCERCHYDYPLVDIIWHDDIPYCTMCSERIEAEWEIMWEYNGMQNEEEEK